jgi:hypothetical protein
MVDLSTKSRHGPSERPQPIGIALWSLMLVPVVQHTFVQPLTRFNESAQHWGRPVDRYNRVTELTYSPPYMKSLLKIAHASSLLDARRIQFGKWVERARKGLLIGKAHAAGRVCWLRVQMLARAMQY